VIDLPAAAAALLVLAAQGTVHQHVSPPDPQVLAPGYAPLKFTAPVPGTYDLPPLGTAADGEVLDGTGKTVHLRDLYGTKLVLLSFIYTSCSDANGCPLASFVVSQVQQRLLADAALRDRVRLVSLSFDPAHDTPSVMRDYGQVFRKQSFDWRFLTTASQEKLEPILADYNQSVQREYDSNGRALGTMSHILRVYLIDRDRRIRNIYSQSFLHPDVVLADIRTLLTESGLHCCK
jgi:cytochrome c peroxidase